MATLSPPLESVAARSAGAHDGGDPQTPGPAGRPVASLAPALPQVSVVIPFYNEEENVTPLLEELYENLRKLGRPYEVIGVDDGSFSRSR